LILLDATAFALLASPAAKPPTDPATGQPVARVTDRFSLLEAEIQRSKDTIIIPTPALAEVLVGLEDQAPAILQRISRSTWFKIVDFDTRAAVEVAAMTRDALRANDKKAGSTSSWQKVKIDRQIIAIARVMGAKSIYSDDDGVAKFAKQIDLPVVRSWEMPLPPDEVHQGGLFDSVDTEPFKYTPDDDLDA